MNVAKRLRARFPSVPDDIIASAAEDVSRQLRLRGWRVNFDGSILYVRRERAAGATETYRRTMRRAWQAWAAWVALLSIVRWWSEIAAFFSNAFSGSSGAGDCGGGGNLTIKVCGIHGAIISLLPIMLIMDALLSVLSAAFRQARGDDDD